MKKIYVADKETGTFIEEIKTIQEGKQLIKLYEQDDKRNDCYTFDFYDIVDENRMTLIY